MYKLFQKIHSKRVVVIIALIALFALQMQAEITALTLSPATPQAAEQVTVTPTIASVPDGTVYVCWGVYTDENCTSKIDTILFSNSGLAANAVLFTAPASAGTYYIKCELHTGGACNGIVNNYYVESFTISQTSTPTGVEEMTGEGLHIPGAYKEFIDGVLYIVRDGIKYDARGTRVE